MCVCVCVCAYMCQCEAFHNTTCSRCIKCTVTVSLVVMVRSAGAVEGVGVGVGVGGRNQRTVRRVEGGECVVVGDGNLAKCVALLHI